MPRFHQIHAFLRARPDPCVDQALAQALPTADQASLGPLADILMQRRQAQGAVTLVQQYHRLPEATRQTILRHAPEMTAALRTVMNHRKDAGPANALQIIRRSSSVRLAYLVADLLRQGQDAYKDEAAQCLFEMASRTTGLDSEDPDSACEPVETAFIASAMRDAIKFYAQHQRKQVLLAIFSLPLPAITELFASMVTYGKDWTRPVGILLTQSDSPAARRALLPALAMQPINQSVLDGIAISLETGHASQALHHWHLLGLKRYRNAVKRIKNTERFLPDKKSYSEPGPVGHTRGLVAWLSELPMETPTLVRKLGVLNKASDPATRLAALRKLLALAGQPNPQAMVNHAIAGYCKDPQPELIRIALTHLIRCNYPDITKVLAQLINSPDPQVQQIASKRLVPVAFTRLWDSWPSLDQPQKLAAGRALIKIDPCFHTSLHDKLCLPDPAAKSRALSIISELNQGLLLQDKIRQLCHDPDRHVVASAVKALGTADPDQALPEIERSLAYEDDRVRANAVEALGQLNTGRHADLLAGMTGEDEANRARANAIHALMRRRADEAIKALSKMLADARKEHRVSALWVAEEASVTEVARDVAEMSITEPDKHVRQRAGRVFQHIIDRMSQPVSIQVLLNDAVPNEPDHAAVG